MIPPVVASERGAAQTRGVATRCGGCRTAGAHPGGERKILERIPVQGDRPVLEARGSVAVS